MPTVVGAVLGLVVGVGAALAFERRRQRKEGRLSLNKEHVLRQALAEWAERYSAASPTSKAKDREVDLFHACTYVGLMWIPPKTAPPKCQIPPPGWECSRKAGHGGPCAARPTRVRP